MSEIKNDFNINNNNINSNNIYMENLNSNSIYDEELEYPQNSSFSIENSNKSDINISNLDQNEFNVPEDDSSSSDESSSDDKLDNLIYNTDIEIIVENIFDLNKHIIKDELIKANLGIKNKKNMLSKDIIYSISCVYNKIYERNCAYDLIDKPYMNIQYLNIVNKFAHDDIENDVHNLYLINDYVSPVILHSLREAYHKISINNIISTYEENSRQYNYKYIYNINNTIYLNNIKHIDNKYVFNTLIKDNIDLNLCGTPITFDKKITGYFIKDKILNKHKTKTIGIKNIDKKIDKKIVDEVEYLNEIDKYEKKIIFPKLYKYININDNNETILYNGGDIISIDSLYIDFKNHGKIKKILEKYNEITTIGTNNDKDSNILNNKFVKPYFIKINNNILNNLYNNLPTINDYYELSQHSKIFKKIFNVLPYNFNNINNSLKKYDISIYHLGNNFSIVNTICNNYINKYKLSHDEKKLISFESEIKTIYEYDNEIKYHENIELTEEPELLPKTELESMIIKSMPYIIEYNKSYYMKYNDNYFKYPEEYLKLVTQNNIKLLQYKKFSPKITTQKQYDIKYIDIINESDTSNISEFNTLTDDYLKIEYLKRKCTFKFPYFYDNNIKICLHTWIFLIAPDNITEIVVNNICIHCLTRIEHNIDSGPVFNEDGTIDLFNYTIEIDNIEDNIEKILDDKITTLVFNSVFNMIIDIKEYKLLRLNDEDKNIIINNCIEFKNIIESEYYDSDKIFTIKFNKDLFNYTDFIINKIMSRYINFYIVLIKQKFFENKYKKIILNLMFQNMKSGSLKTPIFLFILNITFKTNINIILNELSEMFPINTYLKNKYYMKFDIYDNLKDYQLTIDDLNFGEYINILTNNILNIQNYEYNKKMYFNKLNPDNIKSYSEYCDRFNVKVPSLNSTAIDIIDEPQFINKLYDNNVIKQINIEKNTETNNDNTMTKINKVFNFINKKSISSSGYESEKIKAKILQSNEINKLKDYNYKYSNNNFVASESQFKIGLKYFNNNVTKQSTTLNVIYRPNTKVEYIKSLKSENVSYLNKSSNEYNINNNYSSFFDVNEFNYYHSDIKNIIKNNIYTIENNFNGIIKLLNGFKIKELYTLYFNLSDKDQKFYDNIIEKIINDINIISPFNDTTCKLELIKKGYITLLWFIDKPFPINTYLFNNYHAIKKYSQLLQKKQNIEAQKLKTQKNNEFDINQDGENLEEYEENINPKYIIGVNDDMDHDAKEYIGYDD